LKWGSTIFDFERKIIIEDTLGGKKILSKCIDKSRGK